MMHLFFGFGNEKVLISVNGTEIYFSSTAFGVQKAPIEGLSLSKIGVIKEFPKLEGDDEWRSKAIKMFKEKISKLKTEKARANYIVKDLAKFGYVLEQTQKEGFRPKKVN